MNRPHFLIHGCQVTPVHIPFRRVSHYPPQGGQVNHPRHTRDQPRPRQVVPFRLIIPEPRWCSKGSKMALDGSLPIHHIHATCPTSGSPSHVKLPHFRFSGSHVIRPYFQFGGSWVTRPQIPVRQVSRDYSAPLVVPRVSGDPATLLVWRVSHRPCPGGQVTLPSHTGDPP